MALHQLKMMMLQGGLGIPPDSALESIKDAVDVVVQLKRGTHGVRYVSEIYYAALHRK